MAVPAIKPRTKLDVSVEKPTPYSFDLGLLLANDPNPITTSVPPTTSETSSSSNADAREAQLAATARDAAQALINQLLTTCPLASTQSGVLLTLPGATTALPREKPLPEARAPTKWEQFAARKGIKPKTREQRRMKGQQYDEQTGRWERTWGWDKGGKMRRREEGAVQHDWLVEVDEQKDQGDKRKKEKEARKKRRKA
ncbi:ribosomal biogenesis regulatory protein [Biscogniauxia mediterranea]|nr:ribosomal biogenesis regulatory protein [Biscogniauxia mediterranea]